ncbi:DUF5000 domain-containing lipoprotein [Anseongella ginsenosidimutans]|uniref:DUF5000 domain-containing lipoprotein n=1 Tax=Anseongella ginsenosidimutans TaxID=496056 RepID=UPI0013155759|nr:DUF5000 domain-containing lipoprotein [Anseongella ginsenosidimutans]
MSCILLLLLTSCERLEVRDALENDDTVPGSVTGIEIENISGGAIIRYTLPDENDLLYVLAEYEIRPGIKQQVKASLYNNSLVVLGFGEVKKYPVTLYTVDRSGNRSEPEHIQVQPTSSPVRDAFNALEYESDFGGINLNFRNEAKADLSATILIKDAFDEWIEYDKYYTALVNGSYAVRGLPAEPTIFGVYISDRWENTSDTLIKEAVPLFEEELDKEIFELLPLPGDAVSRWNLRALWDNNTTSNNGFHSSDALPKRFQFNLGEKSKLSRFRIWGIADGREYSSGNIKEFEIWGSDNPSPDGSYDGWTLLGEYEVIRPSGLNVGDELTAEDREQAAAGFEFIVPPNAPAVRYIRFKILSSFASPRDSEKAEVWFKEFTFWGQYAQ